MSNKTMQFSPESPPLQIKPTNNTSLPASKAVKSKPNSRIPTLNLVKSRIHSKDPPSRKKPTLNPNAMKRKGVNSTEKCRMKANQKNPVRKSRSKHAPKIDAPSGNSCAEEDLVSKQVRDEAILTWNLGKQMGLCIQGQDEKIIDELANLERAAIMNSEKAMETNEVCSQ